MDNSFAILIMTCDKTFDVFSHFSLSIDKYWPNRNLKLFIGANSNINLDKISQIDNSEIIITPGSNWGKESLFQLQYIKENYPGIRHILVFLDDFILREGVDQLKLDKLFSVVQSQNIAYLRLKRLEGSLLYTVIRNLYHKFHNNSHLYFKIPNNHPYYSSLQVALWDIEHLIKFINRSKDIWDFEHLIDFNEPHYSVFDNYFSYRHVVEKGEWEIYAEKYCLKHIDYFKKGGRNSKPRTLINLVKHFFVLFKFKFLGYSILRFKSFFSK